MSDIKTLYILTTVCEREIENEIFPTLKTAQEEMRKAFFTALDDANCEYDPDDETSYNDPYEHMLNENDAYANDMGLNHSNLDWKITEVNISELGL